MRSRTADEEGEPLVFDLLGGDDGFGVDEVSFGPGSRRPGRRGVLIAAGLAAAGLVAAVMLVGNDSGDSPSAAATSVSPATTTTSPARTTSPRTTTPRATTTVPPYVAPPAFATDPGYDIYLTNQNGSVFSYDLSTGVRTNSPDAGFQAVVPTADGPAFVGYGEFAAPDGTVWAIEGSDLVTLVSRRGRRQVDQRIPLPAPLRQAEILGLDGLGRAVLRGPDLRGYAVDAAGGVSRLSDDPMVSISAVGTTTLRCNEQAQCRLVVSAAAERELVMGEPGSLFWVARPVLSPDGGWIGAVGLETASLGEAVFGPRFAATLTELETGTTFELATTFFVNSRDAVAWSPDGRYAFYVSGNRLHAFDTVDRVPIEFDLRGVDDTYSVIGAA